MKNEDAYVRMGTGEGEGYWRVFSPGEVYRKGESGLKKFLRGLAPAGEMRSGC